MIRPERIEIIEHVSGCIEYLNDDELDALSDLVAAAKVELHEKREALRAIIFNTGKQMEKLSQSVDLME